MKKFTKTAIVMLMFVLISTAVAALAACDSISEIEIEQSNMPQVVYVQGQELDLSGGLLTVSHKKDSEQIALDSSNVTITGYDKNALGSQELTVEYKGSKTTFTVTVVERMQAENYTTDYFVGESFDKNSGRIRITQDDGSDFTVLISDEKVAVTNGNFTSAGASAATVTYTDGSVQYSCNAAVNVYNIDGVEIHKPNKLSYKSHEIGIDLSGGYVVLKGNDNKLTKQFVLTDSMVSEFDLSVATVDNITTPYKQTVTLSYLDKSFDFDISITYSGVSYMQMMGDELSSLNWSGNDYPSISEEQGESALEAFKLYYMLSDADKSLVSDEQKINVARVAAVYGTEKWTEDLNSYSDTFYIENSTFYLAEGGSYEVAHADYDKLADPSSILFTVGKILVNIDGEFGDTLLTGDQTISDYLMHVYDPDDFLVMLDVLEFMFDLYDSVKGIPADWKNNVAEVKAAINYISREGYLDSGFIDIYYAVFGDWCGREPEEFFEIFYDYCYENKDVASLNSLVYLYLPDPLYSLFWSVYIADDYLNYIDYGYELDTTTFIWIYNSIIDLMNGIYEEGDEKTVWLYENIDFGDGSESINFDALIFELQVYGYYSMCGSMLGLPEFDELCDVYFGIVKDYLESEDYEGDDGFSEYISDNGDRIEEMLYLFVNLTSVQQSGFLCMINPCYNDYYFNTPEYALDYSENYYTYFTLLLGEHYAAALSEDGNAVLQELLLILENYSLRYEDEDGTHLNNFLEKAENITADYEVLDEADKDKISYVYDKCMALYEMYDDEGNFIEVDLGEWKEKFEDAAVVVQNLSMIYTFIYYLGYDFYTVFLSQYEYLESIANSILESGDEDLIKAYMYQDFPVFVDAETKEVTMASSLEYAVDYCRGMFTSIVTEMGIWDIYYYSNVRPFLADSAYVFTLLTVDEDTVIDGDSVLGAMAEFRELDNDSQMMLYLIDGNMNYYYSGIEVYFTQVFTDSALVEVADMLLDVEYCYVNYVYADSNNLDSYAEQYYAFLTEAWETFNEAYEQLSEEDAEIFEEIMSDMHNYYSEKCA